MKNILILLSVMFIANCTRMNEKKPPEPIEYYYKMFHAHHFETSKINGIQWHDKKDSLLVSDHFYKENMGHEIRMYTNDKYAPTDGGGLNYELDSIGIIYGRSTTWPSYMRLQCNTDSINELIDAALEYMLLRPDFHCYQCREYYRRNPKFSK